VEKRKKKKGSLREREKEQYKTNDRKKKSEKGRVRKSLSTKRQRETYKKTVKTGRRGRWELPHGKVKNAREMSR